MYTYHSCYEYNNSSAYLDLNLDGNPTLILQKTSQNKYRSSYNVPYKEYYMKIRLYKPVTIEIDQ